MEKREPNRRERRQHNGVDDVGRRPCPRMRGEYTGGRTAAAIGCMEYRQQVAIRCNGEDFVVALQPEDEVVFRTKGARALRNLCRAIDTTLSTDDWTWPPESAS